MYLISNRHLCSKEKYIKTIVEAAKNNVEYLILREKDLEYEGLEKLYNEIVLALKENNADIKRRARYDVPFCAFCVSKRSRLAYIQLLCSTR